MQQFVRRTLILITLLVLLGSTTSYALPLVDQGDTTFDPNTGLTWLDVNLTLNARAIDIGNFIGAGKPYEGYRLATNAELHNLLLTAHLPDPFQGSVSNNILSFGFAVDFVALFGPTFPIFNVITPDLINISGATLGIAANANQTGTYVVGGVTYADIENNNLHVDILTSNSNFITPFPESETNSAGLFLVRDAAVPGPIVGAGLPGLVVATGIALAWWRRKRKAAT